MNDMKEATYDRLPSRQGKRSTKSLAAANGTFYTILTSMERVEKSGEAFQFGADAHASLKIRFQARECKITRTFLGCKCNAGLLSAVHLHSLCSVPTATNQNCSKYNALLFLYNISTVPCVQFGIELGQ